MVVGVSATFALAGAMAATAANAATIARPGWHTVGFNAGFKGAVSAVVATGKTTGWAFVNGASGPLAYERTGAASWKQVTFPALKRGPGEGPGDIMAAGASSPSNVWALEMTNFGTYAYKFNGHKWTAEKAFFTGWPAVTVLSPTDVWVFSNYFGNSATGVWHFNGTKWTDVSPGFGGGYARTGSDVWAFNFGTTVGHYNGKKFTTQNLARLLPAATPKGKPRIVDVLALAADNVYAVGIGSDSPVGNPYAEGGPFVVLHYNGGTWRKVATANYDDLYNAVTQRIASDGKGGFYFIAGTEVQLTLLHYSNGKISQATPLGNEPQPLNIVTVSQLPGTDQVLAGGYVHAADSDQKLYAQLYQGN
jgi:hypothetical protein